MEEISCDILVVGGGVAGLSSAIAAGRRGSKTVLIEKEWEIGRNIKGECIRRDSPIFDTIFGVGLPKSVVLNDISCLRFYAPNPANYLDMPLNSTSYVTIDYRLFIGELFKELSKTDCHVLLGTELMEITRDGSKVIGALCRRNGDPIQIASKYVIAADGNHSKICQLLNLFIQEEVYPAVKLNYEHLTVPEPEVVSIFVTVDPAAGMWFFPKGKTTGELGITLWTHEVPDNFDILDLWTRKSIQHLLVSKVIEQGKCYYMSKDYLNFGGPVDRIFGDGTVFVGDSGGHIGSFGASGIIPSMTTGYECADFIANALMTKGSVSVEMVQGFLAEFDKTPVQRWLKKEQRLGKTLRRILFEKLKTTEAIDENWGKIRAMLPA